MNDYLNVNIDGLLEKIENEVRMGRFIPIVGPIKGNLLYILAKIINAKRVLELGTAVGYSTALLVKAIKPGTVVTIEANKQLAIEAKQNLKQAKISQYVNVMTGDARIIISALKDSYDLVFLDIAKEHYIEVLEDCIRLLRRGGLLIADNANWEVLGSFREALMKHPNLETRIINLEDGMAISRKIKD